MKFSALGGTHGRNGNPLIVGFGGGKKDSTPQRRTQQGPLVIRRITSKKPISICGIYGTAI